MRRALLLTSWYFPVKVIHWQSAVKMIYEGTVDVLAEYDEEIRSPSVVWKLPAVVRLRRKTPSTKRGVKFSRLNVYQRDGFCCQYCGRRLAWSQLTFDHVVPRCMGGRTTFMNVVTACKPCNAKKDNRSCDEAGMFPINKPTWPKQLPVAPPLVYKHDVPEEWEPYLASTSVG